MVIYELYLKTAMHELRKMNDNITSINIINLNSSQSKNASWAVAPARKGSSLICLADSAVSPFWQAGIRDLILT